MAANVKAFVFCGGIWNTSACYKYRLKIQKFIVNSIAQFISQPGTETERSTQLKRCYLSADITQMQY
jgi:hypothetical protein